MNKMNDKPPNTFLKNGPRWVLSALAALAITWLLGFAIFMQHIKSSRPVHPEKAADAIIVLTGGAQRVNQGLDLLAQGQAKTLFITGVNGRVTLDEILDLWKRPIIKQDSDDCCIILDHKAQNTIQNARETKLWAQQNGIKTIRLVTSDYHMPRARLEFRANMPDVEILPWPVRSLNSRNQNRQLWQLCFGEYNKSLITLAKIHIAPTWLKRQMEPLL